MPTTGDAPREPEIEFLGRLARRALRVLRAVLWVAGAAGIVIAAWLVVSPSAEGADVPWQGRLARNSVWVCAGLPLVLPVSWTFGRGRPIALLLGAALWFGPMLLDGDLGGGAVIRMFATFVACAALLVLRTLASLSATPAG